MINRSKLFTFLLTASLGGSVALATEFQSPEDQLLEKRIQTEYPETLAPGGERSVSVQEVINQLNTFKGLSEAKVQKCNNAKTRLFAKKYVLSVDENGEPCRIYDLSFPTLKTLFYMKKPAQVPVQSLSSGDFLNWLDGNTSAIQAKMEQYKQTFNPLVAARTSWVSKLKFRNKPQPIPGSTKNSKDLGLPESFVASDLDLGNAFHFDDQTRAEIQNLISEVRSMDVRTDSGQEPFIADYWLQVLDRPETILESVRFQWNDKEKAYDLSFLGEFLPLNRPVTLIDYRVQYKFAVEKIVRQVLASGLQRLAAMIPVPMVAGAVDILVTDTFELIEMMYDYQMNQLDDSLRRGMATADSTIGITGVQVQQGINILAGERSDLLNAYIMSVAQKKQFDWSAIDKIGRKSRYMIEKQREISMSHTNSKLVLEKKCQVDFLYDYFAVCSKDGKKSSVYSLITNQTIFTKNIGAPMVYDFNRPNIVAIHRGLAWAMSIALRLVKLPLLDSVLSRLETLLKEYKNAGLVDEGILRNGLSARHFVGEQLSPEDSKLMEKLYMQNLNPLLPKSLAAEESVIEANLKILNSLNP